MSRRDWNLWRLHVIRRGYTDAPQYGCLLWRPRYGPWTFDIWTTRTLWTVRWVQR